MSIASLHELIHQRRSIRKYKPDAPPTQWIEEMAACARWAPSASNNQPVRIMRLVSETTRARLRKSLLKGREDLLAANAAQGGHKKLKNRINAYYRYSEFMFQAPWLFAVGSTDNSLGFKDHLAAAGLISVSGRPSADIDISVGLFLQGFILKATELGLGTCILTAPLVFVPQIETILAINTMTVKCFVTAGFPNESPNGPGRKTIPEIYMEI